jgi:hypothetical protein
MRAVLLCLCAATAASAQDLEPKAYSASPIGAVFVVASVGRSTGSVVTDPTLPLRDVKAEIHAAIVAGGYTFAMFGKLAMLTAAVPYSWGEVSGMVGEETQTRSVTRSGPADLRAKLSVNLMGNPAMRTRAFAVAPRKTIVGTSLTVIAPTGEYDNTKLINLGANRWTVKPEVGVAVPLGPWDFDAYAGVWLFTRNPEFFPGDQPRSQDAVVAIQGHASYTFRPRLWLAVDATWYAGGGSRVGDAAPADGFNNSRLGATLSLPIGRRQSFKVAYSSGVAVRTGTDFRTVNVGYQWLWFTKM